MKSEMKAGDLVVYSGKEYRESHGVGIIVSTNPMYAFVKWARNPSTQPFITNKRQLEVISESR